MISYIEILVQLFRIIEIDQSKIMDHNLAVQDYGPTISRFANINTEISGPDFQIPILWSTKQIHLQDYAPGLFSRIILPGLFSRIILPDYSGFLWQSYLRSS